jgi:Tfp pilus tip-associated adhesin PilY1
MWKKIIKKRRPTAKITKLFPIVIIFSFITFSSPGFGDDTSIFEVKVSPDVLFLLDCSGSMSYDPTGNYCYDPVCAKIDIAKEAVRKILDDNGDGNIDSKDEDSLKVRIGYMRFYSCYADESGNYRSGCNILMKEIGSSYSVLNSAVQSELAIGGTPLVGALGEAKLYLDDNTAADSDRKCRSKSVILISDGMDTFSCSGDGSDYQYDMYKRRKAVVYQAKALADAGYKVFVVGFGANMPLSFQYTLNWMAYFGKTDNPNVENSGDTSAITPTSNSCVEVSTNDPGNAPLTGYAFLAANANELNAALKAAITLIQEAAYSFSSPSVAATRAIDENYLYEPVFFPKSNDPFWRGYLKRYTVNSDGNLSAAPDWDAGVLLQSRTDSSRLIYTYKSGAVKPFTTANISPTDLGLSALDTSGRNMIVGFIRGEAAYNLEGWKLGDIFHSNPVTVGRPSSYFNDTRSPQAFSDFREAKKNRERLVFVGANDGQLHAFQGSDGVEKWSFILPNLLPKLRYIAHSSHPTSLTHQYFADGPVTAADVWLGSGTGTNKSASEWKTLLIVGEGEGVRDPSNAPTFLWSSSPSCDSGFSKQYDRSHYPYYCSYHAFDITDTSANSPVFKWRLNPNSDQAQYLAEPFSKMAIGRVLIDGNEKWVGFIGGGYVTQGLYDDDDNYDEGNAGKGFFVVDLSNGNILWSYTKGDNSKMYHSIPAPPAVVDTDNDGFVDTVYLADLGSNVFKFRFCTYQKEYDANKKSSHCGIGDWSGSLFFHGTADSQSHRPVFVAPAVAKDASSQLWVLWGTGDKEDPTSTDSTTEKFFAVIDSDPDSASQYHISDLQDISTGTYSGAKQGWYTKLPGSGEKVLANATVFGGMAIFTTYTPDTESHHHCGGAGTSKLYAMAIMPIVINGITYKAGAGVLSEPADKKSTAGGNRSITLGEGVPTGTVISQRFGGGTNSTPNGTDLFISLSGGERKDANILTTQGLPDSPLKQRLQDTAPSAQILHWWDQRVNP